MEELEEKNLQQQEEEEYVIIEDENDVIKPEDDDESDEDERLASNELDEEDDREAIRERRRQEKKERKERREQAIKRDKTELDFLRKRNDDLERRLDTQEQRAYQGDLSAYDQHIAKAQQDAQTAERIIAKAIEAGNGEDVMQAIRYRDQAMQQIQQLSYQKQTAQRPQPKKQQQGVAPEVMHYAKEFIEANPWYNANGQDEDSAIVLAIDQTLTREGFDPRSVEYWEELRNRAAKRLPDRFEKATKRESRRGPSVGSGKEHAPTSTRKEIYISPERKQALIEAGVWDDPQLRARYIKRYAEYDRKNH